MTYIAFSNHLKVQDEWCFHLNIISVKLHVKCSSSDTPVTGVGNEKSGVANKYEM